MNSDRGSSENGWLPWHLVKYMRRGRRAAAEVGCDLYADDLDELREHIAHGHPADLRAIGETLRGYAEDAAEAQQPVQVPPDLADTIGAALTGDLPRRRGPRVSADAFERRKAAYARWVDMREDGQTYEQAIFNVADEEGVAADTVRDWVKHFESVVKQRN